MFFLVLPWRVDVPQDRWPVMNWLIRVTRQYAGRTVRCVRCHHPIVIPDKTDFFGPAPSLAPLAPSQPKKPKDTHIRFVCACGKRMKALAQHAGRTVKCPHCGMSLKIPTIAP